MTSKQVSILLAHAFVGWALCAATMWIGMALLTLNEALVIHMIAAPIIFGAISQMYFRKFHYTTALQTAAIFVVFVIAMDFFVVGMLINRSFDMFASPLGTWLPFTLIFASTYLTGRSMGVAV